jgi:hypothetical protein
MSDINIYMPVKHIEEMGELYSQVLAEGQKANATTDMEGTEAASFKGFTEGGPHAAEGFEESPNDTNKDKKKDSAYNEKGLSQPVVSEGKGKGKGKPPWMDDEDDEDDEDSEEKDEKSVKKEANKINNSTMRQNQNKSTFDRLYEDVMGDEEIDLGVGDELGGDELGLDDEGGDTVTLDLPRDVAETLHGALGELLGNGEDEMEDLEDAEGGLDDLGMDEEGNHGFRESHVELTAAPDATASLQGQNNKAGGSAHAPAGGSADGGSSGQDDGGKPKNQPEGFTHAKTKNNKVGGKVTGGNKEFFKA